jgi:hypothetical protein
MFTVIGKGEGYQAYVSGCFKTDLLIPAQAEDDIAKNFNLQTVNFLFLTEITEEQYKANELYLNERKAKQEKKD